jgi:hypothetical protein
MKTLKLITQIDRVNYFSDNFINYYKRFFNPNEFRFMVHKFNESTIKPYLYAHGFTDDEMEIYDIRAYGWGDNIKRQNEIKKRYIDQGYIVVYADMDERIFHPDLRNYILTNLKDWIVPTGMSLMQHPSEHYLDETRLVLEQRSYGKLDRYWFSKVSILARDFEWLPGRHTRPINSLIDPNVYLIDIGKLCKDFMLKNNEESRKIYQRIFWRYSTDKKNIIDSVFAEHKGDLEPLPKIIKDCLLF